VMRLGGSERAEPTRSLARTTVVARPGAARSFVRDRAGVEAALRRVAGLSAAVVRGGEPA